MPGFLVAPTEPALIKTLGHITLTPERYGADILWMEKAVGGLVGVQRKEFHDLIASVGDGRLAKEVSQLAAVSLAVLVVEGRPHWGTNGMLVDRHIRWSRTQYRSLLRSVQVKGILVEHTDSTGDTVQFIEELARWASKPEHLSLSRRPKPKGSVENWGKLTDKDWACHMLQSAEGIGPKQAEAIWDFFEGHVPIGITVTEAELSAVPGLGPKKVKSLIRAFGSPVMADG